jgi:hypothetical protein
MLSRPKLLAALQSISRAAASLCRQSEGDVDKKKIYKN